MNETLFRNTKPGYLNRQSGIELLKIFGILLVVLSHVVQTLTSYDTEWSINISGAITNPISFVIVILRYSGALGNFIFFTCSAWFLLDKENTNYQKVARMVFDIFCISIIWLISIQIFLYINNAGKLSFEDVVHSLLPTFFSNNWYMTSYILFYLIYPFLNLIIKHLTQRKHLIISFLLFISYFGVAFLYMFPWSSTCIFWLTIYFVLAYFKIYKTNVCNSKKINYIVLFVALLIHILLIVAANFIYIKFGILSAMKWNTNNNPFLFLIAFSALNLIRRASFSNKVINYVSSLSMLIYVIHENILFRRYLRPLIWEWVYKNVGYDLLLLWIFVFTIALFSASLIVATVYKFTLENPVHKLSDFILSLIKRAVFFIANKFIDNN